MKIVALYKTWDGGEFVDASLSSLYSHVSAIIMVHSEVSWLGERGNTVREPALEWCRTNDVDSKVQHVNVETTSQEQQYQAGLHFIANAKIPYDIIMVVDADEVWESQYIENAIKQISDRPAPAYLCQMHTYLKTPFFRVDPPYGNPVAFLREPTRLTRSPRGSRGRAHKLSDCWMHHYTYVRQSRSDVERKLHQSCKADRDNEVVIPGWMENVYDRLPAGENLHAFQRHTRVWRSIQKVWTCDLPPAMRQAKLLNLWWPDQRLIFDGKLSDWVSMLDGEVNAIYRLALGREQAVDLGTYRGVSAVTLALACRRVHTIDFYDRAKENSASEYATISGHSLVSTQAYCDRFGNMTCEDADTVEAASRWNRGLVDVLFVDADHSEQGTLANVEAWKPHLRKGASIIFHDDNDSHPGVRAAIWKLRTDQRFRFISPGKYSGSIAVCEVVK